MRHLVLSLLAFTLISTAAVAAPKSEYRDYKSEPVFGPGSLTAVGIADTSNVSTGQALSAMFSVNQNWLQTFMSVEHTLGTFSFGAGAIYKFTVAGDRHTGFHVGPGFSIGTVAKKFAFSIYGLGGAHFTLFDHLMLSVDGGPILAVVDGDANFRMKPMGETLGLGIHYLF